MNHPTSNRYWVLRISWAALLLVLVLVGITIRKNHVSWVAVDAELIDVVVIQKQTVSTNEVKSNDLMIQYVYQFVWKHDNYVSRDWVHLHRIVTNKLTANEIRLQLLMDFLSAGVPLNIYVNPNNPHESTIKQPVFKTSLFGA